MASKTTTFLVLIIISLCSFSTGEFEDFNTKMNLHHSSDKESDLDEEFFTDGFQMGMGKFSMIDRQDYDHPVANRKHEPQKLGTRKP